MAREINLPDLVRDWLKEHKEFEHLRFIQRGHVYYNNAHHDVYAIMFPDYKYLGLITGDRALNLMRWNPNESASYEIIAEVADPSFFDKLEKHLKDQNV